MSYLLDTHILLWMLENDSRLSPSVLALVTDRANPLFVSVASLFEIAIKTKIGKLDTQRKLTEIADELTQVLAIELLPIQPAHLDAYEVIPLYDDHRDPFDRLLIATALAEGLTFISEDKRLERYGNWITLVQ